MGRLHISLSRLILQLFFLPVVGLLLPACTKNSSATGDTHIAIAVDTAGILMGNKWLLAKFWFDMNNNGRIDSGETANGLDFINVYSFPASGIVTDSSVSYLSRTGSWHFKDAHTSAFYCTWNASSTDLHYIVSITDTTLVTRRWGTNESWYFSKH